MLTTVFLAFTGFRAMRRGLGLLRKTHFGPTLVTIHPLALLRLPELAALEAKFARFVAELRLARIDP